MSVEGLATNGIFLSPSCPKTQMPLWKEGRKECTPGVGEDQIPFRYDRKIYLQSYSSHGCLQECKIKAVNILMERRVREAPPLKQELLAIDSFWKRKSVFFKSVDPGRTNLKNT